MIEDLQERETGSNKGIGGVVMCCAWVGPLDIDQCGASMHVFAGDRKEQPRYVDEASLCKGRKVMCRLTCHAT